MTAAALALALTMTAQAKASDPPGWFHIEPPGGGFLAAMPGKPRWQNLSSFQGGLLFPAGGYLLETPEAGFFVIWLRFPGLLPRQSHGRVMDSIGQRFSQVPGGRVVATHAIPSGTASASAVELACEERAGKTQKGKRGAVRIRIYVSETHLHICAVGYELDAPPPAEVAAFFDAFRVVGGRGRPGIRRKGGARRPEDLENLDKKDIPSFLPDPRRDTAAAAEAARPIPRAEKGAAWYRVVSDAGQFSAMMPTRPDIKAAVEEGDAGPNHESRWACEDDRGRVYTIRHRLHPDALSVDSADSTFDNIRSTWMIAAKHKVVSERDITLEGYPGRETIYEAAEDDPNPGRHEERTYLLGLSTLRLTVFIPKGKPPSDGSKTFFESFRLARTVPKAPEPTTAAAKPAAEAAKPAAPPPASAPSWYRLSSDLGAFKMTFPARPAESNLPAAADEGRPLEMHRYASQVGEVSYAAMFGQGADLLPVAPTLEAASAALKGLAGRTPSGKMVVDRAITLDGRPARETTIEGRFAGDRAVTVRETRHVVAGIVDYQLVVSYPKAKGRPADAAKFFEAFHLAEAAPAGGRSPSR